MWLQPGGYDLIPYWDIASCVRQEADHSVAAKCMLFSQVMKNPALKELASLKSKRQQMWGGSSWRFGTNVYPLGGKQILIQTTWMTVRRMKGTNTHV